MSNTALCETAKVDRVGGTHIIPAYDCQYPPAVHASDLLRINFDKLEVGTDGLYLVEMFSPTGATWRGCRRFQKRPTVHIDVSGDGEWRPYINELNGMRVVGYVEQVYRPV